MRSRIRYAYVTKVPLLSAREAALGEAFIEESPFHGYVPMALYPTFSETKLRGSELSMACVYTGLGGGN